MLAVEFRCKTIMELGVGTGESTVAFLMSARETGGHVYSVDRDACPVAEERVRTLGLHGWWTFMQEDDIGTTWWRIDAIDMLFIDTDHEYNHTLAELMKFEPLVRPGGIIAMHDSVHDPPVRRAAMDYFRDGKSDTRIYEYLNNNGLLVIFR